MFIFLFQFCITYLTVSVCVYICTNFLFIKRIEDECNSAEKIIPLVALRETILSRDLYEAVKNTLQRFSFPIVNNSGNVTDGAPLMNAPAFYTCKMNIQGYAQKF